MPKAERILKSKAISAAKKKLPILGNKALNENLSWAADDYADAYRIGAEEAQREILIRLNDLKPQEPSDA